MSQVKRHDEGGGHLSGVEASKKYDLPLGRNLYSTHTVDISGGDPKQKAEAIRQYFHNTFEVFERVFDCIACDEGFYRPPKHRLRHPMIFYYGHTACFYVNKLVVAGLTTRINPKFEEMFAVGVDEMSWDDLNDAHYSWPKVAEVKAYRLLVRDRINELITSGKFELNLPLSFDRSTDNDDNAFWWVMLMGIEHERIHLETASVHIREMDISLVKKNDFWDHCPESGEAPQNELVPIEGQKGVLVGRQLSDPEYGWDTDYSDNHRIDVAPFKASKFLVSNAEFLEFMKDGGYTTHRFWDEEGWKWVSWRKPSHPYFWVPDGEDKYKLRVQTEEIPLPKNWPVDVNWLEGRAFINWKGEKLGKRLRFPTEAEWLLMRDRFVGSHGDQHQWVAGKPPGNINLEVYRSSCPVDKFAHGPLYDVVGNTWQHIETPIYPYPGYKVHPFYDDFSLPTFDGRHSAMRGGAWISTGNEASRDARFGFRRHFFQCIGIRYIEGEEVNETKFLRNVLGLDPEVDALTDAAFGAGFPGVQNFGVALADTAKALFRAHAGAGVTATRALDLFCGAGRTTFELTSDFAEVVGSDFSARKLIPGFSLRERGEAMYSTVATNGLREGRVVKADSFPWGATRERATFFQADPTNLHPHMDGFDLIVACGVLERSYKPAAVPAHLASRLKSGGVLVIASTFAFDEEYAHRDEWLCGSNADDARNPETEVIALLAGVADPVAAPSDLVGYFPQRERVGQLRTYRVLAFRKK